MFVFWYNGFLLMRYIIILSEMFDFIKHKHRIIDIFLNKPQCSINNISLYY